MPTRHRVQKLPAVLPGQTGFPGLTVGHLRAMSSVTQSGTAKTRSKAASLARTAVRAERKVVRVQRRMWLAQLLLWPLAIGTALLGALWLARTVRRARPAPVPAPADVPLP